MKEVALITGASAGIGAEFARIHASKGRDLVLVARSEERLQALADELQSSYKVEVKFLPMDLSYPEMPEALYGQLRDEGVRVDYLINNAGFGELVAFDESDPEKVHRMVNLNIDALTQLTRSFGADMLERGQGRVLNVASTAAFQPGPFMAVYYASKSYVLSFSRAVHHEWKPRGVTVTTLCPGPTSSEFQQRAGMEGVPLFDRMEPHSSAYVAFRGYSAMEKGRRLTIPGLLNKLGAYSAPLMPDAVLLPLVQRMHNK